MRKWECATCGHIHDEAEGDELAGITPGTRFEDLPQDWECPICGARKEDFRLLPE